MFNIGGQAWDAGHRINGDLLGFKFGAWEADIAFPLSLNGRKIKSNTSDQLLCNVDMINFCRNYRCKLE